MGLNGGNMGFGFTIQAQDLASGVLKDVERHVQKLDSSLGASSQHIATSFGRIGMAATTLAAGFAPLGAAMATAKVAGDFVQGLAAVSAATNATSQQMRQLHDAALQAGLDTQFTPTEAVQGLISLATAGQTAAQSMQTLRPALDLAAASLGQLSVDQASEAIVGTLNSYAFGAERAVQITDKLVQTTMLTNFQAKDFASGLARAAEAGSMYGQSIDDVLIGMGLLRNRNIMADVASTALRNAMVRVNSDVNSQNLLLRAGVPLRDQYTGQLRSILDVISEFATATQGLDPLPMNTMVKQIFGEEGMPAFSAVMNANFTAIEGGVSKTYQGAQAIAAMRRELETSGGASAKFVRQYNDNFQGQLTLLKGSIHGLIDVVGESFGAVLRPVVEAVTGSINRCLAVFVAMPRSLTNFAATTFLITSALAAFATTSFVTVKACTAMRLGLMAMRAALMPTLAAVAAAVAPYLGVVSAVVGGMGLLYAAYKSNLGGMAQLHGGSLGQGVPLYWQGLRQVMDTGALQGQILARLNQSDTEPLKQLVVGSYQVVHAFATMGRGIQQGFSAAGEVLAPFFHAMEASLGHLRVQWLRAMALFTPGTAHTSMQPFVIFGRLIGFAFASMAATATLAVTALAGILDLGLRIFALFSGRPEGWQEYWQTWAEGALSAGRDVSSYFASLWDTSGLRAWCARLSTAIPDAARRGWQHTLQVFEGMAARLREMLRPAAQFFNTMFASSSQQNAPLSTPMVHGSHQEDTAGNPTQQPLAASLYGSHALPAAVEVKERTRWLSNTRVAAGRAESTGQPSPITVAVQIDGETVAKAVARANKQNAARHFAPLVGF